MTDNSNTLRAAYFTLGCKLNFAETATIGKILREHNIMRVANGETPDICIVNTCSVTEMADKKGRRLLRHLASTYPDATIVATGCYAQLKPEEVKQSEGVDIVLGSDEKLRMAEYIEKWLETKTPTTAVSPLKEIKEFRGSCERGDRTRYFLKVQDGCNYFCTYCTIPFARGTSRSGSIDELVAAAENVAREGGKEIVINGVNIGCFGLDTGESFFELLKRLDAVEGIERYRISSIEPNLITEEILEWIATESKSFMPHFHIPLQAGSDAVLKLMNRRYDTSLFAERIAKIRSMMPDAFIGIDIIAGARGETPEEWQKSLDFVSALPVTRFHIFPYSERPGTVALNISHQVPREERRRRVGVLSDVSDSKMREFMSKAIGSVRNVLWEHSDHNPERMHGFTDNYLRITAPVNPDLFNTITPTRITGFDMSDKESLVGEPIV